MAYSPVFIHVSAGIIRGPAGILCCRRSFSGRHPGRWEFPGGKQEPGETAVDCLRRELCEELDVNVHGERLLRRLAHTYPNAANIDLTFFHVQEMTGEPRNLAFAEIRWVPPGRLSRLDFLEADLPVVREIDDGTLAVPPVRARL